MKGAFKIGRIAGIDISIHYTLLLAMALFTWLLGSNYFPAQIAGAVSWQYWIAGFLATVMLFVSVLLHEMAHQYQIEILGQSEDSFHGHGPVFRDECNRIAAIMGITAQVIPLCSLTRNSQIGEIR
jgi:hypothetical protein